MTPQAILETAIYTDDLAAAEAFYGGLLGLPVVLRQPRRHVFFRVGAGILLVFDPAATEQPDPAARFPVPTHGARGLGHLCFAATRAEIDRWRDRFAAVGIPVEAEFDWPNGARSLYVRDPAGNSVEFAEPALWQD
ncbi:VOC family protein [Pseudogemmobacter blasticus]|uniref:Glyoxalase/bleomycin resistance/extradiol dioxygenase family protein n=1 Tax=Fuscovulum blasticum DSM 2131 TaxID=1188250 RepID=A0A2T4J530_FUSBL|nr:VOC family protein [Fuscovulum blasticum]PTE13009.1 glyoxalase/bleomycin resistance/extradiol dioxygenase family protein [Fuscovulum blasticum DSM 2131]